MMELAPDRVLHRRTNADRQLLASKRRERLVLLLSEHDVLERGGYPLPLGYGRCAKCLRVTTPDLLEVDHCNGCDWDKRKVNAWRRVARYWRELTEGVALQSLCRGCNASDGKRFRKGQR